MQALGSSWSQSTINAINAALKKNAALNQNSSTDDSSTSLFGNDFLGGSSFLDVAKALAQQKANLAKAERGDIFGYRTKEMAQQAGYQLGQIKEQGGIQKGLEELRQAGMTGRTDKEIQSRQTLQQMNQDFTSGMTERNRAAALSAGRAGSLFY
jgi:hypothetical protein